MTKILFFAPRGLAALLRGDRENRYFREKMASGKVCSGGVSRTRLRCFFSSMRGRS